MTELQHFREPLQDAMDGSERYNGYHLPNGYRVKERPKKRNLQLKIGLGILALAIIGLIVFASLYFSQPSKYAVPAEGNSCDQPSAAPAIGNSSNNPTTELETKQEIKVETQQENVKETKNEQENEKEAINDQENDNEVGTTPLIEKQGTANQQNEVAVVTEKEDKIEKEDKVNESVSIKTFRLSLDLHPESYIVKIIAHLKEDWTTGEVIILFKCVTETNRVVVNIKNLYIEEDDLNVTSVITQQSLKIDHTEHNELEQTFTIHLQENLIMSTRYNIYIKYSGRIKNTPRGLYRTFYMSDKNKSSMLNTLFSPTDARSVFPCFDEPSFKARFTFSIGRPSTYISLSNMKINYSEPIKNIPEYFWDHFGETPLMPTYLTAFMITQYQPLKTELSHTNISFTSYSKPSTDSSQMAYVLRLAVEIMQKMEIYFQIKYPLPKLDIVAVSEQYFVAMENWGLIVFRENVAFVDETTTESKKQDTALILAHEMAHQWFGNLVTPKWWDNLWLKEGFSTYFAYLIIDQISPTWQILEKFQYEIQHQAFKTDALQSSSAIAKTVSIPTYEIFDDISYNKGASLIRMMAYISGSSVMEQAIRLYLERFSYGNADQDDLWNCIMKKMPQQIGNGSIDIKTIMDTWTLQAGYPIVNFIRDYDSGSAIVTQERFLLNEAKDNMSNWWIPLSYTTEKESNFLDTAPKIWINESKTLITHLPKGKNWIIANLNQAGFYHVNYDIPNWKLLIDAFDTFPNNIKAQLLSDSLHLAQGSRLSYDIALSLTMQLTKEYVYLPWKAVTDSFFYMENLLKNMPAYGNFRTFVLTLMERVYTKIAKSTDPWADNADNTAEQIHMENIINLACHFDHTHCLAKSLQLFDEWMNTEKNTIPEAIRKVTYCTAIKKGAVRQWDFALNMLRETSDIIEQRRRLYSLGCSRETWLLTRSLSYILPNEEVYLNTEEILVIFESVASNDLGHQIAISFVRHQWPYLLERFGTPSIIYKMISNIVGYINTPYQVEELKSLVKSIEEKTKERSKLLHQTQERAENNLIWMKNNYQKVASFINIVKTTYNLK